MNSAKLQDTKLLYRDLAFLYTNNELSEKSRKQSHLLFHQKVNGIVYWEYTYLRK